METLSKLFGSEVKVKIMRLFLFNPERVFYTKDICHRTKTTATKARREISTLEKIGLIKRRMNPKKRANAHGFILDSSFNYLAPLQNFLINIEPFNTKEIIERMNRLGTIKLIILAGVFVREQESRVDILVVGDHIKKSAIEKSIKTLESEIGKELKYAYFTTEDFKYRFGMFDKLVRDILDYPHKKVLNRLGIQ